MIGTSLVTAVARMVRVAALTFAATMFVAYVAVQAFSTHYAELPTTRAVVADPPKNPELAAAISEQASRGLCCREEPALTDTVLFQDLERTEVQVLTFEQAISASSAREGRIRRYCL